MPAYKNSWVNNTPAHPCAVTVSGVAAGDLLLIYAQTDQTPGVTFTWPSGFTQIAAGGSTYNGGDFGVAYKVATGSEGSLSVSNSASNTMIVGVVAYAGVSTTNPLDVTSVSGFSNTGAGFQNLSITPVTNGATLVFISGPDTGAQNETFAFSTQSGTTGSWTTRVDANSADNFFNVGVGDALQNTAGAVTARVTWTNSQGPMGVLVALRPAAGSANHVASYQAGTAGSGSSSHTNAGVVVQTDDIIAAFVCIDGAPNSSAFSCADNASGGSNTYYALTAYGDDANGRTHGRWYLARAKASETLTLTFTHNFNSGASSVHVIRGISNGIPLASLALLDAGLLQPTFQSTLAFTPGAVPSAVVALVAFSSTYDIIGFSGTTIDVGTNEPAALTGAGYGCRVSWKMYASAQSSETWTQTSQGNDYQAGIAIYLDAGGGPPAITVQPSPTVQLCVPSQSVTLSITATGATSYQWQQFSGTWSNIGGATSSSYNATAPSSAGSAGIYRCVATNANGSTNSSSATLFVPLTKLGAPWGAVYG